MHPAITTPTVFKKALRLMGNQFELSVVAEDEAWAHNCIDKGIAEIQRIEKLLTTYAEDSETNQVNAAAGISPVKVSEETFRLIQRSIRISDLTQGAFDITYGSVDKKLWNFDSAMTALPDAKTAKRMVRLINYRNIILDDRAFSVFLKHKGMRIGFGGIGKGYAAEMAKQVMKAAGVKSGIVNASGDLTAWGTQPNGEPWTIGIVDPNHSGKIFSYMNVTDVAVATSGNYEKFIMVNGVKYSHTIDPKTGLPVRGIKSVTIITPNAEIADAMATPVTIMGIKAGLDMINQIKNIEAILIDDQDVIYTSKNLHFSE
ncbi:FAD:protein FMN transferase [Flavihumibacter fluvii]|uniref:FAD:protein FMN transferase n=1 Tax=Flavihumibacter fluvii TaxID=2838157 RepID=UPI001BDE9DA1|nr:FAD:protein FMN transferase [Flavihumibacter fluvii]ULQ54136.1 FAD:protein FMN transferase [Flavihumibacter fluvii]